MFLIVTGLLLVQYTSRWIKELLFYRRNGWNFTLSNGEGKLKKANAVTNRGRVLYGYPLGIVVLALVFWYALIPFQADAVSKGHAIYDNYDWIVIVVLSLLLLSLIYWWIKDLLFYKRNGWDFDQPSGLKMYHGIVRTPESEMSNRNRVLFGFPFMIAVFAIVILATAMLGK